MITYLDRYMRTIKCIYYIDIFFKKKYYVDMGDLIFWWGMSMGVIIPWGDSRSERKILHKQTNSNIMKKLWILKNHNSTWEHNYLKELAQLERRVTVVMLKNDTWNWWFTRRRLMWEGKEVTNKFRNSTLANSDKDGGLLQDKAVLGSGWIVNDDITRSNHDIRRIRHRMSSEQDSDGCKIPWKVD